MSRVALAFVVGFLAARCVPEPDQVSECGDSQAVEALARAFTDQALVLEDIHRGCVWVPRSQNLGVRRVAKRATSGPEVDR